jgi:transcriptional regulator GlxA family with amidase domain
MGQRRVRDVLVVVYDGVSLLDVAGPVEVFDGARQLIGGGYRVRLASLGGQDVRTAAEVPLGVSVDLAEVAEAPDTLLVAGGWGYCQASADGELLGQVRRLATGARRVASVCTGAFVLAAAGLLNGRRATTHWARCAELAQRYPDVRVESEPIFVRDPPIATSAGVTAGIDLALALVEEDHGPAVARTVGKWMVVFFQRPGGQSQFSMRMTARPVTSGALREVIDAVAAYPGGDWSIAAMAARAAVSPRHFARIFTRQVGMSPGRYLQRTRVEAARVLLESGSDGVDVVARRCGFGTDETMRRAFVRDLGVAPSHYRDRFRG